MSVAELEELAAPYRDSNAAAVNPYQFEWISGTHEIAFNTHQVFQGPGFSVLDDLHVVNTDSNEIITILPSGMGGAFVYSPDATQIAISTPNSISLVNSDGSNRKDVLFYDLVNTDSEYRYYAHPVWDPSSEYLYVAIPPSDPLSEPRQETTLWYIPTDGSDPYDYGFATIVTKNKIRGKGRVFSFLIKSEAGKDLDLLGWSINLGMNANV